MDDNYVYFKESEESFKESGSEVNSKNISQDTSVVNSSEDSGIEAVPAI